MIDISTCLVYNWNKPSGEDRWSLNQNCEHKSVRLLLHQNSLVFIADDLFDTILTKSNTN